MRLWLIPLLGALPAPAFAPLDWSAWAWVCLAPLIYLLSRAPGGTWTWCGLGWGYGAVLMATRFAWVPEALLEKGGLRPLPFLVLATAGLAVLACYPAAAIALSRWGWRRWGLAPGWSFPPLYLAQEALLEVTPFGGVPWGSLAATQVQTWAARVLVPVTGGLGLLLLIVLVNAAWAAVAGALADHQRPGAAEAPRGERAGRSPALRRAALPLQLALATLMLAWPSAPPSAAVDRATAFHALLVPGDRNLREMADSSRTAASAREFLVQTALAETGRPASGPSEGPALAIWPESAVSGRPQSGRVLADLFAGAQLLNTDLLFGANAVSRNAIHNAAFLVSGERFQTSYYAKQRLVPFGEYVPPGFRALLGKKLTEGVQDYVPGRGAPILSWRGTSLGMAICFESVHPRHTRAAVRGGAAVLVALSNDGWLTPAAARHHLRLSALRGLEAGRDVLFVANRGPSAHLRDGQVLAELEAGGPPRWVVPLRRKEVTPWVRWGPAAPLTLALLHLALGLLSARGNLRRRGASAWPDDAAR